jgi:hypothetical protein
LAHRTRRSEGLQFFLSERHNFDHFLKIAIKSLRGRIANAEVERRVKIVSSASLQVSPIAIFIQFLMQQLEREIRVWHFLHHENILPLHGIASGFGHYTATISPWMENGSLTSYLGRQRQATLSVPDRLRLVSPCRRLHYKNLFFS